METMLEKQERCKDWCIVADAEDEPTIEIEAVLSRLEMHQQRLTDF